MPEWYDRLATLQPGYYYPWRSAGHLERRGISEIAREVGLPVHVGHALTQEGSG
jgi:hypothetical protein